VTQRAAPVLPTVTGFAARRAMATLKASGVALAPLLQRAGLSEYDLHNRQYRISAAAQAQFLEYAADAMNDSAFALHLAERANPREAGLLFYVASAAENLGEALALLARYCRIVNESVRAELVPTGTGVVANIDFIGLPRHEARQAVEFSIAITMKALREAAGRAVRPTRLSFVHARNSDLRAFQRFFGCAVEFAASRDQFTLSNDTLATPLVTEDPYLMEALQPICDEAAKERNVAARTIRASVENEVQKLLPHGGAKKQTIARHLAMSARTLSRRLADEATNFDEVVDQLRRSLALKYIQEPGISLLQIAWLLGYEGSTSFNHAFRRWTGRSPSMARAEKLSLSQ
jgi:AraC-like DNA-binding protein